MGIEIPGWLRSAASIAVGSDWPEGDETAMRRVADSWTSTSSALNQIDAEGTQAIAKALAALDGDTHDAMDALWHNIGGDGAIGDLIVLCEHLADTLDEGATDIEHAKLMILAALAILAAELAAAAASLVITLGASSGAAVAAEAATQVTVRMIIRQLVQKLLSRLTIAFAQQAGLAALRHALIGAATQGGLDTAIQIGQKATGRRDDMDFGSIGKSALSGAVDEVVSSGVSDVMNGALTDASTPLGKLATNIGAEAVAGAASSVASTAATGDEVTWGTLTSGAIGGGVGGHEPSTGDTNSPAPEHDSSHPSTEQPAEPESPSAHLADRPVTESAPTESVASESHVETPTQHTSALSSSTGPASTHASSVSPAPSPVGPSTPTAVSAPAAATSAPNAAASVPAATTPASPSSPVSAPINIGPTPSAAAAQSAVVATPSAAGHTTAPSVGTATPSVVTPPTPATPHTAPAPPTPATPTARPEVVRAPEAPTDPRPVPARAPDAPVSRDSVATPDAAVVSVTNATRHTNGHRNQSDGPPAPDVVPGGPVPEARWVTLEDGEQHEVEYSREQLQAKPSRFAAIDYADTACTGSEDRGVPEHFLAEAARMDAGAEMYRIGPYGTETLIAVLGENGKWIWRGDGHESTPYDRGVCNLSLPGQDSQ